MTLTHTLDIINLKESKKLLSTNTISNADTKLTGALATSRPDLEISVNQIQQKTDIFN